MNIHEDSIDCFLRELRERFKQTWLWPPQYTATVSKFLQTFFGILIISADSRLDMADVFFFKHQKSSSNTWLEPKLDPYPFRHISWCLSKSKSSTCSVSTYIYIYMYVICMVYLCMCLHVCVHFLYYICSACNNVHTWSNIYIYVHILRIYICTVDLYVI